MLATSVKFYNAPLYDKLLQWGISDNPFISDDKLLQVSANIYPEYLQLVNAYKVQAPITCTIIWHRSKLPGKPIGARKTPIQISENIIQ